MKAAIAPDPAPEEVAAIVAALERFALEHALAAFPAPAGALAQQPGDGWRRAALLEGVRVQAAPEPADRWSAAWINA